MCLLRFIPALTSILPQSGQAEHPGQSPQPELAVVISLAAFAFSVLSFMLTQRIQYGKPARLSFFCGRELKLFGDPQKEFAFIARIMVFNSGAQYGVLWSLSGTLRAPGVTVSVPFTWRMFVEEKNVGKEGETFQPHDAFVKWADSLLVPGHEAVDTRIQFRTSEPVVAVPGKYQLLLQGFEPRRKRPVTESRIRFSLSKDDIEKLKETSPDQIRRVFKKSVTTRVETQEVRTLWGWRRLLSD